MKTPSRREGFEAITRHHILPKEYFNHSRAKRIGDMAVYIVDVQRRNHDFLHYVLRNPTVPPAQVMDVLEDMGHELVEYTDSGLILDTVTDSLVGLANSAQSPEIADGSLEIATHFQATRGILEFFRTIR